MRSRTCRLAAGAAAAIALAVTALPAPSGAQSLPGVGSTTGSTTLLGLRIGDPGAGPLDLRLIGEQATTVLDSLQATPEGFARLAPVSLTSSLVPELATVSGLVPTIESRSTGAEHTASTALVDLGALADQAGIPGLLSGSITPALLRTAVDGAGARSLVSSAVTGIGALGGLVGLDALTLGQSSLAAPGSSTAERGVELASLDVLSLDALLGLLGVTLEDLPLDAALGLLDGLGLTVGDLDGAAVNAAIDDLQTQVGIVSGQLTALVAQNPVCDAAAPILGQLGITCADVAATITELEGTVADLIDELQALVGGLVGELTGASLLSLEGIDIDVLARASETVEASAADVTSTIGGLTVAGTALPGLDVVATLEQVEALADQVTSTLDGLLGGVLGGALAGLVDIDLLEEATSVAQTATGTEALASVTGLRITVTPPDICALLDGLGGVDSLGALLGDAATGALAPVGDVLDGLGLAIPCQTAAPAGAGDVAAAGLIDGVATALTAPLTFEALSVSEVAILRLPVAAPAPAPAPAPSGPGLARTGTAVPLAAAGALLGLALLVRRRLVAVPVDSQS